MLATRSNRIFIAILMAVCLFLFALILGINQNSASAGLPPRPEPADTPAPPPTNKGGYIELLYSGLPVGTDGVWTAVQWQDPYTEKWHNVDGWQGTVELDGTQRWWVSPDDLGKGPFRWLVYDKQDGKLLQTSEPFTLPTDDNQYTIVQLPVAEAD